MLYIKKEQIKFTLIICISLILVTGSLFQSLPTNPFRNNDIFIKIEITNRYSREASITVLPTLWFYNRSSNKRMANPPVIAFQNKTSVEARHERMGNHYFYFQHADDLLFTNNVTNTEKVSGVPNQDIFVKDAFHDAIIRGENVKELRNKKSGSKFYPVYKLRIPAGKTKIIYCRLSNQSIDRPFLQLDSAH